MEPSEPTSQPLGTLPDMQRSHDSLSQAEVQRRLEKLQLANEDPYVSATSKMSVICVLCGRKYVRSLNALCNNRKLSSGEPGCSYCFRVMKDKERSSKRLDRLKEIANKHGGTILSESVGGVKERVEICCEKGHEWTAIAQ